MPPHGQQRLRGEAYGPRWEGSAVAGSRRFHPLLAMPAVLAIVLARPALPTSVADDVVRIAASRDNDGRVVQLAADEIVNWTETGEQVLLLRGKVLIEQGVFSLRAERAAIWVSNLSQSKVKTSRVEIVADGSVRVEDGPQRHSAATVQIELTSRHDVRVRPKAKITREPQGTDPFFRRALSLRRNASSVQLTAASAPTPVVPTQSQPAPGPPQILPPAQNLPAVPPPGTPGLPAIAGQQAESLRNISIQRRTDQPFQLRILTLPSGEKAGIVSGGIILTVRDARGAVVLDIEADRLVTWTRGDSDQLFERMRGPDGTNTQELEFYLAGNVEIRAGAASGAVKAGDRVLRAEQVFYDVQRNVAVALDADLEFRRPGVTDEFHLRADELYQVSPTRFEAARARVSASRLPSDPGLELVVAQASVEQSKIERRGIFGQPIIDPATGKQETYVQQLVRGENVLLELEGVPVFYLPFIQGDANDPLGPLESIRFGQDRIFGTQIYTTWDVWNLLNRNPRPGMRWTADFDYLSYRGPAAGSNFEYSGRDLFGIPSTYQGLVKLFGIYDEGRDVLGGGRGEFDHHPLWRGRVLLQHNEQFLEEFTVQGQTSLISDKNFLEQYYKQEFDTSINNETYFYVRQIHNQFAWTGLAKPHLRDWVTENVWLPRADGYIIGQSFFDLFTYDAWGNAGYAQLKPTTVPPLPWPPQQMTDVSDSTGRFDLAQELALPFYLGPVKVVPYGVLDLTYYSKDLNGNNQGRLIGGGGVRGSMPLSHLYPNVQSDLLNLNGLYHKIVLGGNYYNVHSDAPFTDFPQIDRLNDDATDQALRDIYPRQPFLNPAHGLALAFDPIFNPQAYAIRRLVMSRVDTRDSIDVFEADIRQRWQTKRGFPGQEHIVDYFTLDTSASLFPEANRDNFGEAFAFLEYDATWNVGDRTAFNSTGWYDPFDNGARVLTLGAFLNRPDRTNFYVGYRIIDPVGSRALITTANYTFSPKYAITAAVVYDFGDNEALANSLVITRVGSDLTMNIGFNYNAILNNFGFTFELLPNIVASARRSSGGGGLFGRGIR